MATNGQLDTSTLTHIGDGLYLTATTARAWFAARDDLAEETHINPVISKPDGAYRDLPGQRRQKAIAIAKGKPGDAATPGYSSHGWGTAVDINNISRYSQATIDRIMAAHGFTRTIPRESWHYVHDGTTTAGTDTIPIELEEHDMTARYVIRDTDGSQAIFGALFWNDYGVEARAKIAAASICPSQVTNGVAVPDRISAHEFAINREEYEVRIEKFRASLRIPASSAQVPDVLVNSPLTDAEITRIAEAVRARIIKE